jgi:excisionase family DNA binding protein
VTKTTEQWTPDYISVGFIAKGCGVSNTTVLRWISTGKLPAFRLPGGHYRIERSDFLVFMDKHHIPSLNKTSD